MLLKKTKIYNYRQLQEVELDLQKSLTVLVGPNNSGKTTLFVALKDLLKKTWKTVKSTWQTSEDNI